mmetsp:Transcript_51874/g.130241  ORF Transcript_51874/g.130241 Transcript_51874/m.130241 type:complete len:221 (-) Transcript_51874:415-1077(-)
MLSFSRRPLPSAAKRSTRRSHSPRCLRIRRASAAVSPVPRSPSPTNRASQPALRTPPPPGGGILLSRTIQLHTYAIPSWTIRPQCSWPLEFLSCVLHSWLSKQLPMCPREIEPGQLLHVNSLLPVRFSVWRWSNSSSVSAFCGVAGQLRAPVCSRRTRSRPTYPTKRKRIHPFSRRVPTQTPVVPADPLSSRVSGNYSPKMNASANLTLSPRCWPVRSFT